MNIDLVTIFVPLILFVSSYIRTVFGFGDAVLALPLLALVVGIKTAAPVMVVVSSIISIVVLFYNHRHLDLKNVRKLITPIILGIPLGLVFLHDANENLASLLLAIVVIIFSAFNLIKPGLLNLNNDRYSFIFGIVSGFLGGAFSMNGPPIVIYGTLRRWEPEYFRTMIQGLFLPTNLLIMIGHATTGLWSSKVLQLLLISLPFVFISIYAGHKTAKRIKYGKFLKFVFILFLALGCFLFIISLSKLE